MSDEDSYDFDPGFERAVAVLCASRPRFFGRFAEALDPDGFNNATNKLIVKTTKAIYKDMGRGPGDRSVFLQRLRRLRSEGKVTVEEIDSVIDALIDAPEFIEADVAHELTYVLKRRMQSFAVKRAMDEYAKKGDFEEVARIIQKAKNLGRADSSVGSRLSGASFDDIERLRHIEKMPTGIDELDRALGGGVPRGNMMLYLGPTGAGKSMALNHAAATAAILGHTVAIATLELSEPLYMARLIANLTGTPVNAVTEGDQEAAKDEIARLYPVLGSVIIKEFPAKVTTMAHIRDWIKSIEDAEGFEVSLVVIDYLDKLGSESKDHKSQYEIQDSAAEAFRLYVHEKGKWGSTASQVQRRAAKDRNRKIEADDVSDSVGKVRVTDQGVSLNPDASGDQISYHIFKNRVGKGGITVGPLPHDFECARMVVPNEPKSRKAKV